MSSWRVCRGERWRVAEPEKVARLQPKRPDLHIACYGGPGARKSTFFSSMPKPIVVQPKAATAFLERLNRLPKEIDRRECATFCFETVTSSSLKARKMYQYDLEPDNKDPRKWYGGAVDILEEVLLIQLPGLHCNVCVGLHVSKIKVEAEGSLVRAPLLPGRLLESFASQWPEIYRAYIDRDKKTGERTGWLQTLSDEKWEATTQIEAPDPCDQIYKALWKNWDRASHDELRV